MSEITLVDSPLILREADSERAVSGVKIFSFYHVSIWKAQR